MFCYITNYIWYISFRDTLTDFYFKIIMNPNVTLLCKKDMRKATYPIFKESGSFLNNESHFGHISKNNRYSKIKMFFMWQYLLIYLLGNIA